MYLYKKSKKNFRWKKKRTSVNRTVKEGCITNKDYKNYQKLKQAVSHKQIWLVCSNNPLTRIKHYNSDIDI